MLYLFVFLLRWEQGLEIDLFLLQCCAALAPPDLFVKRIQERFGLSNYHSLSLERPNEYVSDDILDNPLSKPLYSLIICTCFIVCSCNNACLWKLYMHVSARTEPEILFWGGSNMKKQ